MTAPHALLYTAPGCPHCPGIKAALHKLQQEGVIGTLESHDITQQPQQAATLGIRSVPWLRLGEFILTGAQTPQQLRHWAELASHPEGMSGYLAHLLREGDLAEVERMLITQPHHLGALLPLLEEPSSPIQVRLGVSAILEQFEAQPPLQQLVPQLITLSESTDHRLRSDACHLLGLTHAPAALDALQRCSQDEHAEVREIATEALELLQSNPK
ncbi:MAG: HEAT repeat domain-containing protein [Chromatiales bacterium]|nr:HEAT repeat domain-containing protein [Chromatiales bacterium]